MRAFGLRLMCAACALSTASCAALWGFDDATLRGDGAPDDAAARDTGRPDRTSAPDAAGEAAVAPPDATRETSIVPQDAPHETSTADPDAAVASCNPPCAMGASCARAVGGASVCVDLALPCADGSECGPPSCCVWLDPDSGTGRCAGPGAGGASANYECLCTGKEHGMLGAVCKTCGAPPEMPEATVLVCSGP